MKKWLNHNRFTVIGPVLGLLIWALAVGCTPTVQSPTNSGVQVNAEQLQTEFDYFMARYEMAGKELEAKTEAMNSFTDFLLTMASGSVTTWPGALQLILGGSWIGLLGDNIRKNGVIGGKKKK